MAMRSWSDCFLSRGTSGYPHYSLNWVPARSVFWRRLARQGQGAAGRANQACQRRVAIGRLRGVGLGVAGGILPCETALRRLDPAPVWARGAAGKAAAPRW
ncbi:MAG: hypothetical protein OHK0015_02840 [Chloroflexi bacterium OHK40]